MLPELWPAGANRPELEGDGGTDARSASARPEGLVYFSRTSATRGVEAHSSVVIPADQGRIQGMRRGVKAAARAIQEVALAGGRRCRPWMVTLTYAEVDGWGRRHVSDFLDCVRKWGHRQGFDVPYVWVAELQQRGAVHYHVLLWLPSAISLPKPDKRGWWRHGMTQVVRARKAIGYLLKYSTKGDAAVFPRGLRLHGCGGLTRPGRDVRYWLCLPGWVHRRFKVFGRVSRLPGGLYLYEETGELARSAWEFVRFDRDSRTLEFRRRPDAPSSADSAQPLTGRGQDGAGWCVA